jgi:hypothetical protein
MNQIFNRLIILVLGLTSASSLTFATTVHAVEGDDDRIRTFTEQSSKNLEIRSKLCERYASGRFGSSLGEKEGNVKQQFGDRSDELNTKRTNADATRTEIRQSADEKRQEHYAKLLETATTDDQKTAVAVFQSAVESAVAERRASLDSARETYRAGVDSAITDQKSVYEEAIATLKSATESAIAKAKASCEAGTSSSEVSATLKAELSAAKEAFKTATKDRVSLRESIKVLQETRKASFESTKLVFQEKIDEAKVALKLAFVETEEVIAN